MELVKASRIQDETTFKPSMQMVINVDIEMLHSSSMFLSVEEYNAYLGEELSNLFRKASLQTSKYQTNDKFI